MGSHGETETAETAKIYTFRTSFQPNTMNTIHQYNQSNACFWNSSVVPPKNPFSFCLLYFTLLYLSIHPLPLIKGGLEPVWVEYNLDRWQRNNIHAHVHTYGQLRHYMHVFGLWEEARYPGKVLGSSQPGDSNPWTVLLHHCAMRVNNLKKKNQVIISCVYTLCLFFCFYQNKYIYNFLMFGRLALQTKFC